MLFCSPISASTRPSRTRRSAMLRYSSLAFSSVVSSSAKVALAGLQVVVDRLPDVLELLLDQARRRLELWRCVELVEQRALDLLARHRGVLAATMRSLTISLSLSSDSRPSDLANSSSTVTSLRRLDRLHGHLELGLLAGELLRRIGLRERHLDRALLAGGHADQLVLEARNERARAEHARRRRRRCRLRTASPSIVPVKSIVTRSPFSALRALALGRERTVLLGDRFTRFVDFGIGHFGDRAARARCP